MTRQAAARVEVDTSNGRFGALIGSENRMMLVNIAAQHNGERAPA